MKIMPRFDAIIIFALALCSAPVFAEEPCPSEVEEAYMRTFILSREKPEAKPVDPNEKC